MKKIIAIDGPAASGKSTVAKLTAQMLHGQFVSTGSLYRLIAYFMLNKGVDVRDEHAVGAALSEINLANVNGEWRMNNVFFDAELRRPEVGEAASVIAVYAKVRSFLLDVQRNEANGGANEILIMEGRDIGTAVFPGADLKIFLTASSEERALRRLIQEKGADNFSADELAATAAAIEERDYRDSHRAIAPLQAADDAEMLDNSKLSAEESAGKICTLFRNKMEVEK